MKRKILMTLSLLAGIAAGARAQQTAVTAREGTLELPTYVLNAAETAPIFERDWSYQRARRSVYPYALDDNMTRDKKTVSYKALYLENEYVELCVLPEIGGRLFYAIDKTNGYDIFYHQHVVKPANVGMTGAWISGGVEWNVFHHHRATSNIPCDYRIVENGDGSKTIWVGETELRHRMSWAIGITLRPGKSYMEITGRLVNSTENDNSMLYWSNVSTLVDDNYQIIFPQSTEFVTFHCKNWFAHWPVTREPFNGIDEYADGIDASWWKNHFMSNSMFVHDLKEDFIAGYDHGRKAGTMLAGNHHIVKGGKFWLWGPNSEWDTRILTDSDGHYCELMVGAYSDNQPDYNWSAPYEVKEFTHYWYGLRDIGGVKTGNRQAALNLDLVAPGKALIGVNATEKLSGTTVALTAGGRTLFTRRTDLAPDAPFVETVAIDKTIRPTDLRITLTDAADRELLAYSPVERDPDKPLPEIVKRPLRPEQIENTEECYLVGMRNLQFHNPFIDPTDYFEEVLRRDPGDTRANTQMGVWWRQRGDNEKAARYLRKAIERQTKDYTRPKDCEAMYNLGLILKQEGKVEAAMDTLYRAVWNYNYNSAGNFQLAQLYVAQGDIPMALERLDEAIARNADNFSALNLKATILRTRGDKAGASACVKRVSETDPVNAYAAYEQLLLGESDYFETLMRDEPESYLELALAYLHNGFPETAVELLERIDARTAYPTVKMWLGYLAGKAGDKAAEKKYFTAALAIPTDRCNPFRLETAAVLERTKELCPESYKPCYYLGNRYYNKQPDRAMAEWEQCIAKEPSFAMAWRNLGWAHWLHTKNYGEAVKYYRKAIDLAPEEALFLEEIDQVYEAKGEDVQVRYDLLKSRHAVCTKRYSPLAGEVTAGIFVGDYDYVLKLLKECYFPTREGVANFHDVYVDALLLAGEEKFAAGQRKEALGLFESAFDYPENHQVFLVDKRTPRDAQIYWFIGNAYERMGNRSKAMLNYKKAAAVNVKKTDYRYWQGLALEKLGKKAEAEALFEALVEAGKAAVVEDYVNFYGAEGTTGKTVATINTRACYTQGLGQLGLGNRDEARKCFAKSVELKPDNLWSAVMLRELKR